MNNNPCISCGLCCIYYPTIAKNQGHPQEWAHIRDDEIEIVPRQLYRITRIAPKLESYRTMDDSKFINKFIKDKPDKDWKGFRRCIALEGTARERVSCTIYEDRPKVCSDYEAGSDRCNNIREWGGLEKLI